MNYFITSSQDMLTSSIETAEVKRLRIFDLLKQSAAIITLAYNHAHKEVEKKLGVGGRVLNLYQYFQKLPYNFWDSNDEELAAKILHRPNYTVKGNEAFLNGKKRIQVIFSGQRIYSVSYFDHFGFLDQCDFFDCGCLSYREFYEDRGRLVTRQYVNNRQEPILTFYYRGGEGNVPVLTLIQLNDNGNLHLFDNKDELRAYFLDQVVEKDPQAAFICDRSDYALTAFGLMHHQNVPRYQVFHSSFTIDGQSNGQLFDVYKPIKGMLEAHQLNGLISSTTKEAHDAKKYFATDKSYAIPVTYVMPELLNKQIPFANRKKGQLIAVARLSEVKRLDHIINAVILLHRKLPFVDLKIYGYDENINNYAVSNNLKQLVKSHHANDYIHFCGYQNDLTKVYETADIEVLTSSFEGFAMALLEAQSHACPVVSYDINYGPADIIDDNVSGRLIPSGDTQHLYTILYDLLTNRDKLQRFSNNAQAAVKNFLLENVKADWRNFLKKENLIQH